jgi:pimeloyl-ACP methyl ester carboxylesterase
MHQVTKTIVLIHGLWMTPRSWDLFHEFYQAKGYRVFAPAWARLDGEVEDIRRDPSALAGLGITEVVDHYKKFIRSLDEPPILSNYRLQGISQPLSPDCCPRGLARGCRLRAFLGAEQNTD